MRKNKKNKPAPSKEKASFLGSAGRNMTYRDLKRKAIVLGMPFPDACAAGVFDLIGYIERSTNKPDKSLIDQYDDWMDKQLENIGYSKDDPLRNSKLRLGFLGEEGEDGKRKNFNTTKVSDSTFTAWTKNLGKFYLAHGHMENVKMSYLISEKNYIDFKIEGNFIFF